MFEITAVKHTEKFVKIDFETGESLRLSPEIFGMYSLKKGEQIDRIEYQQLKEESERFSCTRKALDYIAARIRSEREVENYLNRKKFSKHLIKEIILKLKDAGYIDDYKFAVSYINYKKERKAVGENLIKSELFKKGVAGNIVKKAMRKTESYDIDEEALYQLALKKARLLGDRKNKESKIVFFLKQRGFRDKDIRNAISGLREEGLLRTHFSNE